MQRREGVRALRGRCGGIVKEAFSLQRREGGIAAALLRLGGREGGFQLACRGVGAVWGQRKHGVEAVPEGTDY